MSRDLQQLLHETAVEPSRALDTAGVVARGRRRRRLRHGAAVVGSMAGLALAFGLATGIVVDGPAVEPQPPEVTDRPSDPRPDDDPEPPDGQTAPDDAAVERIPAGDAGRPLLLADERGVHRIDGGGEQQLWDAPAALALPDHDGGVVVQQADGAIRRLTADGEPQPPFADPEQRPTLHTVVEAEGAPAVLFTRREGQGDAETETLHAHRLDDGTEEDLGVTGRLESGLSAVTRIDDDLLLSRCHLECELARLPWGADPEAGEGDRLHDRALPIHGLDRFDTTAVFVHLPLHAPDLGETADDGELRPHLWLHDVAADERDEIPLASPDEIETAGIGVDVADDGSAALVGFHPLEQGPSQTLLVDDIPGQPRLRWLETTGRVRLDVPP